MSFPRKPPLPGRFSAPQSKQQASQPETRQPLVRQLKNSLLVPVTSIQRRSAFTSQTIQMGKPNLRTRVVVPKPPQYITSPIWGASTPTDGGTSMSVVLGPAASQSVNYGSKPLPGTPGAMTFLKTLNPEYHWKAGHLLNDNLGGHGVARNLTPLSVKANRRHATLEGRVKRAIDVAWRIRNDDPQYWYGVRYKVTVSVARLGAAHPLNHAPASITVKAKPVKVTKNLPRIITDLTDINPMHFKAFNLTITNDL